VTNDRKEVPKTVGTISSRQTMRKRSIVDYGLSVSLTAVQIAIALLLFHLIAKGSGPDGFAVYILSRNLITLGLPLVGMGLSIATMRFLPGASRAAFKLRAGAFSAQALYLLIGLAILATISQVLGRLTTTTDFLTILLPAYVALCGVSFTALGATTLRGVGRPFGANALMLFGLGIAPVASYILTKDISRMLVLQGIASAVVGVSTLAVPPHNWDMRKLKASTDDPAFKQLREMLRFGWRRTFGDVSLPAMFALPTVYVAYMTHSAQEVSAIGFTSSAVALVCTLFSLLTPVLLPRLSPVADTGDKHEPMVRLIRILQLASVIVAATGCLTAALFSNFIVKHYLGEEFVGAGPVLRIGILVTMPMAAFYAARPLLETRRDRSITARLLSACLALEILGLVIVGQFIDPLHAALTAWLMGSLLAGVLAYLAVRRWTT